jgi:hypothetical protein
MVELIPDSHVFVLKVLLEEDILNLDVCEDEGDLSGVCGIGKHVVDDLEHRGNARSTSNHANLLLEVCGDSYL